MQYSRNMKFSGNIKFSSIKSLNTAAQAILVGVFDTGIAAEIQKVLPEVLNKKIEKLIKSGEVEYKLGSFKNCYFEEFGSVVVLGLGEKKEWKKDKFIKVIEKAASTSLSFKSVSNTLTLLEIEENDWRIKQQVLSFIKESYQFEDFKSESKREKAHNLDHVYYLVQEGVDEKKSEKIVEESLIIASAINLAKDLGNTPSNICTPTFLSEKAKEIAQKTASKVKIYNKDEIEQIGMHSFLAVAKGSDEEPKFIELQYKGGKAKDAPYVLVGKGITFDSGGISIKPAASMDEMKYDMFGAASVLGAFYAVASLKLPINLVCLVASCENMPSGKANKPGDVVKSLSGITIEVLNTDAEGRMILADALSYALRFNPKSIVDVATLTGACVIALGSVRTGLFSNDEDLANDLLKSGERANDLAWRLPLDDGYFEQIKGQFGDIKNTGGRAGGSITAAKFLEQFVSGPWAHLDIAGTAWKDGGKATGRPVSMLVEFFKSRKN